MSERDAMTGGGSESSNAAGDAPDGLSGTGTSPSCSAASSGAAGSAAFDAVVVAGGLARRFEGESKPDVVVDGRRMLDHVLAAVAGARRIVLVAPDSVPLTSGPGAPVDPARVRRTMEDPPRGGPAAGLAAGVAALDAAPVARSGLNSPVVPTDTSTNAEGTLDAEDAPDASGSAPVEADAAPIVVLSCDVPRVGPAVPRLLAALEEATRGALRDAASDGTTPGGATSRADSDGVPGHGRSGVPDGVCLVTPDAERGGTSRQPLVGVYRRAPLEHALAQVAQERGTITGASIRQVVALLNLLELPARGDEGIDIDSRDDLAELLKADFRRPDPR